MPVVSAAPAPRPILDFASLPFMAQPTLSPDGRKVAARLAVDGRQMLGIIDLFAPGIPPAMVPLGQFDLLRWEWVNNGWLVVTLGARTDIQVGRSSRRDIYVRRIAGVSADGRTVNPIKFTESGANTQVIWTATDGSPRILATRQTSIMALGGGTPGVDEVDVSTGKVRRVNEGRSNVFNWYTDTAGAVRMGVGYDDVLRRATLLYRPDASSDFRAIDRVSTKGDDRLRAPLLIGPGAPTLTIAAPAGFDALYDFDMTSLTTGKRVWGADGYDIDGALIGKRENQVIGIRYTSDRPRVHWLLPELAAVQTQLDSAVPGRVAQIESMSDDRKRLLVRVGDPNQPGSYFFYDADKGGAMTRFAYASFALKSARLGPVSTFRYKARDGLEIEAVLTLPPGRDAKALPLILLPHGGPRARDEIGYDWIAQFLADRGYAVVQPNYRGSTGYGDAFQKAGDGEWGGKMQDDLNDAVDDLVRQGVADPKRVTILGASYGGYAALRAAQRDGARYRGAISFAGVSDMVAMLADDGDFLGNGLNDYLKRSAPKLRDVSPIAHAEDFATPVLMIHGAKDMRVPVAQSRRMAARLKGAGKPVEYIEQPEGDHFFTRQADRVQFLESVEAFLKKHNPA